MATDALQSPLLPPSPGNKLDSVTALARFEFEPGKGNEGTKVMMVEWQDDDKTRNAAGSWEISWTGKRMTFPAGDEKDKGADNGTCRLYFLLPPKTTIPPQITISYKPPLKKKDDVQTNGGQQEDESEEQQSLRMEVTPLPAIFTPELGATAKASGKKGVLHTIWAKKRLQVLDKEIRNEKEFNLEGIALEMAVSEKKWIEQNFGIGGAQTQRPTNIDLGGIKIPINPPLSPGGVSSPRSPGGRRLTDKLKGLSLVTNDSGQPGVNTPTRETNPLSPEAGDMAVSSFSAFRGEPLSQEAKPAPRRMVAQAPPEHIKAQQALSNNVGFHMSTTAPKSAPTGDKDGSTGDDLFAKALSPRSPDAPKSPFSMSSAEVGAFAKIKGIQPASTF